MDADTMAGSPPLPEPDETTRFFWDALARGEFHIQRCQACKKYIHYPKPICRFCQSRSLSGERVSGRASLYSWTLAVQGFHPFWIERLPLLIATVELEEQEGLMFTSQLVGCSEEELRAGMPLEVVFEDVTPELTLPFFRLANSSGEGAR
jgi:uncharacterized OB-fold protein